MISSSPPTLAAMLKWRAGASPHAAAQWGIAPDGNWQSKDWNQFFRDTAQAAAALRQHGLHAGDRLGIMAPTQAEWDIAQMAALAVGAVVVGIDSHEHDERLAQILNLSALRALVVADETLLQRVPSSTQSGLKLIVTLASSAQTPGVVAWPRLLQSAGDAPHWVDDAQPHAPALVVFTSGTTGAPKGIAYTHAQVMQACDAILSAFPDIGPGTRLACWLPLSNLFQRMLNFCAISRGAEIYYVGNPRDIMRHVPRIAPQVFIAVPRFYEKFHAGIMQGLERKPRWQQGLFERALALARLAPSQRTPFQSLAYALLDRLALRPARLAMGGQLRFCISGSAPMPEWLLADMAALGMPVYEAYGMSENIIPISLNRPDAVKFGSVGQALPGNEIRIAEDGELWVRGPGVFLGYLGEAPAPRSPDGYFASGDFAQQDAQGFITLTGRKSEIFKTSTGRRIAPAGIEASIKQIPGVEQCMVLGANRPFVIALIWVASQRLTQMLPLLQPALTRAVAGLPDYQRPAQLIVSTQPLSLERGEITPNLKLRRSQIELNYAAEIERLYAQVQQHPAEALMVVQA